MPIRRTVMQTASATPVRIPMRTAHSIRQTTVRETRIRISSIRIKMEKVMHATKMTTETMPSMRTTTALS